jgi:serine/threonine protein phosphatase PrpC
MDGHGGNWATESIETHFVEDFMREFRTLQRINTTREKLSDKQERMIIRRTIEKQVKRCRDHMDGTTLSLVYAKPIVHSGDNQAVIRVHAATLGDSPVAIWNGSRLSLMPVHSAQYHEKDKASINRLILEGRQRIDSINASEDDWIYRMARIEDGYVWRQRGGDHQLGLAMTRAIGDAGMEGLLIRRADIRTYDLPISGMVLLASDGVLDDDSPKAVRKLSKAIIDKAHLDDMPLNMIGKGLGKRQDNTTMMMMRWSGA